jgi:hypothetical protein
MRSMMYPLTTATELSNAYRMFSRSLRTAASEQRTKTIGWPGGSNNLKVHNIESQGYWCVFDDNVTSSSERHWCAFGTDSIDQPMLSITVEINPPTRGIYRRSAGLFLKDEKGRIYLAHSGKVGGGKKGVGKTAFLNFYNGKRVNVEWADNDSTSALLISRLDDKFLASNVGAFVHNVQEFKNHFAVRPKATVSEKQTASFHPEFSGSYVAKLNRSATVVKLHGRIINELFKRLLDMGYRVTNDKHRDLVVAGRGKTVKMLFEAKTGAGLTDIYTGVGQLLIHSSVRPRPRRLLLVLPNSPHGKTSKALEELGIDVLQYSIKKNIVRFRNLEILQ